MFYDWRMAFPIKVCVVCGEEFELKPGKPGFANRGEIDELPQLFKIVGLRINRFAFVGAYDRAFEGPVQHQDLECTCGSFAPFAGGCSNTQTGASWQTFVHQ